jgi:hypothetical protein
MAMILTVENKRVMRGEKWVNKTIYFINGKEVRKKKYDEAWKKIEARRARLGGRPIATGDEVGTLIRPACWPQESRGLAVHPSQAKEVNELLRGEGVDECYQKNGKPLLKNAKHRKQVIAARNRAASVSGGAKLVDMS